MLDTSIYFSISGDNPECPMRSVRNSLRMLFTPVFRPFTESDQYSFQLFLTLTMLNILHTTFLLNFIMLTCSIPDVTSSSNKCGKSINSDQIASSKTNLSGSTGLSRTRVKTVVD